MDLWGHQYLLCLLFVVVLLHGPLGNCAFDAIFQFGDSISDTGNLIRENPIGCSVPPYGETLLHPPTGRCSDGLLIVDFLAKALEIPLLNPYLKRDANFIHGVDFSVAGATALDASFLAQFGVTLTYTNSSLFVQLEWFKTHLKSFNICSSKEGFNVALECKNRFGRTLFIVGPVGGNDYTNIISRGQTGYKLVPDVIEIVKDGINEVIDNGATHVLVPGYFRLGCYPSVLVNFVASTDASIYDEYKCIKAYNDFTEYHNLKLQEAIKELQDQHPSVSISYGDLDSAFQWILRNAASLGFEKDEVLKTCCGDGNNAYNYDTSRYCGTPGVSPCPDPKTRIFWDGIHLTQQAYNYMAIWLLEHNFRAI